ncbi:SDR family oxidoreductase [Thermophilibacter sp.]
MENLFDLTGKVALVTGASSGLGVQMAKALARAGAKLAICARRVEKLESVKAEIEALGAECYAHACDVTDIEQIKQCVADVEAHYGRIDILVNNAGTSGMGNAESQDTEQWRRILSTNLDGPYYMAREVARGMIERGYGKIVMLGSIHSTVGMAELPLSAYCASKGGILMLTKQLATEWAKYGITVNAIGPAYFPSEMTVSVIDDGDFLDVIKTRCPMGRPGRDGELDGALLYFASDASSYCTGQLLSVDGGWNAI